MPFQTFRCVVDLHDGQDASVIWNHLSLQRNSARAERIMNVRVPGIKSDLDKSLDSLSALSKTLPTVQEQVTGICKVYDSGRQKVVRTQ